MSKLNNIDDAIRNSFDKFEVPFDASQWDALNSKLDNTGSELSSFDQKVKDSLSNHQVAYNPAAWTAVEAQLASTSVSYTKWFIAAGVVGMLSLGYFLMGNDKAEKSETTTKEEKTEDLTADNKISSDKKSEGVINSGTENHSASNNGTQTVVEPGEEFGTTTAESGNTNTANSSNNNSTTSNEQGNSGVVTTVAPFPITYPVKSFSTPVINGITEVCQGTELKLTSSETSADISSTWMLNGVVIGNDNEIILKNLVAGTHEVELIHSATKNTSTYEEPVRKTTKIITVKESPEVDFAFNQIGDASYPEMKLNVLNSEEDVNYVWMMDNRSFTGEEIMYLFKNKGIYPVQLLAETSNGCSRTETKNIEINNDYNLLAPIAFTPNADGHNDVFIPEALKVLNLSFKMNIYDRQQGLVYQSNRVDNPWDGKNMNSGEFCNQGAYRWVVELTTKDGKIEFYQGTITLLK